MNVNLTFNSTTSETESIYMKKIATKIEKLDVTWLDIDLTYPMQEKIILTYLICKRKNCKEHGPWYNISLQVSL